MLNFQKVTLEHGELLRKYCAASDCRLCDYSAGIMLMWREHFDYSFAISNETLIISGNYDYAGRAFCMPIGKNVHLALKETEEYCQLNSLPLRFANVSKEQIEILREYYKEIEYSSDRDWADYLYLASDLESFSGKRYHGQKNHKNRFHKNYLGLQIVAAKELSKEELFAFWEDYYSSKPSESGKYYEDEARICKETFGELEKYSFSGVAFKLDGRVIGVALGEIIGDTAFEHIEKALREYSGIYPALTSAFARQARSAGAVYINREEDTGNEGLRTSKLSLHPVELVEKHTVDIKLARK